MGDGSGPLSIYYEFYVSNRKLITTKDGEIEERILTENFFDFIDHQLNMRRCMNEELPFDFNCGFVGYIGYEMKSECGVEIPNKFVSNTADARLILADRIIAFDHEKNSCYLLCLRDSTVLNSYNKADLWISQTTEKLSKLDRNESFLADFTSKFHCNVNDSPRIVEITPRHSEKEYLDSIRECVKNIINGESYELCLTTQLSSSSALNIDPLHLYLELRKSNPAPYAAFLQYGTKLSVVCCSPERFLKVNSDGWAECKPIKGTLPRGKTPDEDKRLKHKLETSEKEFSENIMIVDLMRNDLGRICRTDTISVPKLTVVESYSTVHQLVSTVKGHLRPEISAINCLRSAFPPGSMIGAPKVRAMHILESLEK